MAFGERRIPKHLILEDDYFYGGNTLGYKRNRSRGWGWIALSLGIVLTSMLLALKAQAASETNHPTQEIQSGELQLQSNSGEISSSMHVDTHVDASISGLIAEVNYEQRFVNNSDDWQEGIYSFPLPENAAVTHMEINIGDRIIIGKIKKKKEAKRIYAEAKKAGKTAALTEQQRPNMFSQKLANIAPRDEITVRLRYVHSIDFDAGQFNFRLPTTYTPRYIPGKSIDQPLILNEHNEAKTETAKDTFETNIFGWAQATDSVPDAALITPPMVLAKANDPQKFSISINLNSGLPLSHIDALYHQVQVKKKKGIHHIQLSNRNEKMDRDFVLQWSATNESTPEAAVFIEEIKGEDYALLMVIPPNNSQDTQLARDIVFVIDTSGSMQGTSITQAKTSLELALQQLKPHDRFNIIEFNSKHTALFTGTQEASNVNIHRATNWVKQLEANGGTEMYSALESAFNTFDDEAKRLQQLVFITDGSVGNETQLFTLIHHELKNTRLFTVGIGSAPNAYFMKKAAEFGRGSYSFISNQNEVHTTMQTLFTKLESAVSTGFDISWGDAKNKIEKIEQYPKKIGDLYQGEPLLISVKLGERPKELTVKGLSADTPWQRTIAIPKKQKSPGVSSLWARAKIEDIEDQGITGLLTEPQVKKQITSTALKHSLISRFTSFIAVEETISRPENTDIKSQAIPNLTPQGQNLQAVNYAQTATTAEIAWWLGLFSFACFVVVRSMRQE